MAMVRLLIRTLAVLLVVGETRGYSRLSDESLRSLRPPADVFDIVSGELLAPILIPRVPGTEGSGKVQQHIANFFANQLPAWTVSWQNTTQRTPATGETEIPFANLIARREPPGARPGDVAYLTLAAHYDSLRQPAGFVGAVDAAAPCAMLLHTARALEPALARSWAAADADEAAMLSEQVGLQLLFLDGEEAWVRWTATDSMYGSRALAEHWDGADSVHAVLSTFRNPLDAISLFVLLDLLGAPEPTVPSYFVTTHWAYQHAAEIERRLRDDLGVLETRPRLPFLPDGRAQSQALAHAGGGGVVDDHVPFMSRGVDVLHIIPSPFPMQVWHTLADDGAHLDLSTVRDWARIMVGFVAEWMELDAFIQP